MAYSEPESKGYSAAKLDSLAAHLERSGSSSMLLLVDGDIIFEWGHTKQRHVIHSIRKCLLNSLYGIAVEKKIIDTTMTLRELGINDMQPCLSEKELDARVADLLKSRSGVYHHAAGVSKGMLEGMPERHAHPPGEHYYYNNWDFNVLGAILERESGQSLYTLFKDQIAKPLGMKDYKGRYTSIDGEAEGVELPHTDGFYQFEKSKSRYPAYHFRMSARDLARYGQLYLNKGKWMGVQLVSEKWIEASTRSYSLYIADYGIAYGMLWYVLEPQEQRKSRSYFHTGVGIHMLGVYPESDLVLVHRVNTEGDFAYNKSDLYKMIGLVFDSKLENGN
jgi:CubicO group peptidase (beta-lactamase class C family)